MQPAKRLRRSCEPCAANKVRCDGRGEATCSNCARKGIECEYRERRRPGRAKKQRPEPRPQGRDELQPIAIQPHPRLAGASFGGDEVRLLRVFNAVVNPIEPLLPAAVARDAISKVPDELRVLMDDVEKAVHAAHVATTWAAVAHAAFLMRDPRGMAYLSAAQSALSHCFEVPTQDTLRAYLSTSCAASMACGFPPDERRLVSQRYALFARVMRQELTQLDRDLEACFHNEMVNVVLGGHDDEETMATLVMPAPESVALVSPILGVMYFLDSVLLRLQARARSGQRLTDSPEDCERYLKQAEPFRRILQSMNAAETCPPAQVMLNCIVAFWLFQLSKHQEALAMVAEAVEIVKAKPYTICKPKVWHTLHSTGLWILNFGHIDLAEQILTALRPTADRFLAADGDLLRNAHIITAKSTESMLHHVRPTQLAKSVAYSPAACPKTLYPPERRPSSTTAESTSSPSRTLSQSDSPLSTPGSSPQVPGLAAECDLLTDPSLLAFQDFPADPLDLADAASLAHI